jgi:hypothetical protein
VRYFFFCLLSCASLCWCAPLLELVDFFSDSPVAVVVVVKAAVVTTAELDFFTNLSLFLLYFSGTEEVEMLFCKLTDSGK